MEYLLGTLRRISSLVSHNLRSFSELLMADLIQASLVSSALPQYGTCGEATCFLQRRIPQVVSFLSHSNLRKLALEKKSLITPKDRPVDLDGNRAKTVVESCE